MAASSSQRTKAFISYSHKDRTYLEELHEHLAYYEKQGLIHYWDDQKLAPGMPWEDNIKQAITSAKVAILLVSPSFLASEFINSHELPPLLEAAQNEGALLLVVILRYCLFAHTPLAKFQTVNNPSEPLSEKDQGARDRIWVKVVELVSKALNEPKREEKPQPTPPKTAEQWVEEGLILQEAKRHEEALAAFEQAIKVNPNLAWAYNCKSWALADLERYEEALTAAEHAIQLNPNYAGAYDNKSNALLGLSLNEEALAAAEYAIQLDPNDAANAYNNKGFALANMKRYQKALEAFEQAIKRDPKHEFAWRNKGDMLTRLGKKAEAEQAYKKARALGYKDDE